ncbi:ANTAR domain-containing protein [Streptomyces sp. CA-132043]|uniref:ANTAR domain-containing protein n=1 Tax=Streptomyces sp. CA-132043 TaxID=3240048 RepID=UPI003D8FB637
MDPYPETAGDSARPPVAAGGALTGELVETLLGLSDASTAADVPQRLEALARQARDRLLAGGLAAEAAALTEVSARRAARCLGNSGPVAARLGQWETGDEPAPGKETLRRGRIFTGVSLKDGGRSVWPGFCAAASAVGVRGVSTVLLPLFGRSRGVLVLYHLDDMPVPGEQVTELEFLVEACAQGLQHQETLRACDQLEGALQSRIPIEQAKGRVGERRNCTPDEAFTLLRSYAREHRRSLGEVARDVMDGTLTEPPFHRTPPRRTTGE